MNYNKPIKISDFRERIENIWNKYKDIPFLNEIDKEYRLSPLAPKQILKNAIMFIGVNPSYNPKHFTEGTNVLELTTYPIDYIENKDNNPYFKKFKEIADYCGIPNQWTHLDMLFIRETTQKDIEVLTYSNPDFISEQINISQQIINEASPKIIVVCNSLASEFFGKKKLKHHAFNNIWLSNKLDFNENFSHELGTYQIPINENMVPIFFSGMLSGQRALDLGSLERLKWQLKRTIQTLK